MRIETIHSNILIVDGDYPDLTDPSVGEPLLHEVLSTKKEKIGKIIDISACVWLGFVALKKDFIT